MRRKVLNFVKETIKTYKLPVKVLLVRPPILPFLPRKKFFVGTVFASHFDPLVGIVSASDPQIGFMVGLIETGRYPIVAYNEVSGKRTFWEGGRIGKIADYYAAAYEGWDFLFAAPFSIHLSSLSIPHSICINGQELCLCIGDGLIEKGLCAIPIPPYLPPTSPIGIVSPKEWADFVRWLPPALLYRSV